MLSGSFTDVASLDLPAGKYVVMSRANVIGGANTAIICSLADDAAQNITTNAQAIALSQHSTVTLNSPGTVSLSCLKTGANQVFVAQRWITAIEVNSIN